MLAVGDHFVVQLIQLQKGVVDYAHNELVGLVGGAILEIFVEFQG
jgi:hypothetical protein